MNQKICAVVVTYNRKKLLLECLESLRRQTRSLDGIYVIDNASTDGTHELLKENGYIKELPPSDLKEPWEKEFCINNLVDNKPISIYYVRMDKNSGGAGGFYEGVKRGYEKGYDWLWLMDDDAEPDKDALLVIEKYMNNKLKNVIALCNLKIDSNGSPQYEHTGWKHIDNPYFRTIKSISSYDLNHNTLSVDFSSFVGFLISKDAIKKVGFPRKEFFLHHDDVEYSFRIREFGEIYLIRDSLIKHKDESKRNLEKRKFTLWTRDVVPYEYLWLKYYGFRNLLYLKKKYSSTIFALLFGTSFILRKIIRIFLYEDHKLKRIIFWINGFFDGLFGNFDNEKPRRILYG